MRSLSLALTLALVCLPGLASADDAGTDAAPPPSGPVVTAAPCSKLDPRCERAVIAVSKSEKIDGDFDYDTGWLPKDAAVQVRLLAYLHGRTRVDLAGNLDATWPDPIRLRPDGLPGKGLLAIDDGLVVKAQARFKVTVAGKDYKWEGDIPGAPSIDFASESSVVFDPWAWKGGVGTPSTSGKTKQIELLKVPLTDSFIPIPGIEGGFQLEGQGEFAARYTTLRIAFDELVSKGAIADVDPTKAFTQVLFSSSPSLESTVFIHGELGRKTTLHFLPGFYFTIVGKKFDLELADIPVDLPESIKPWDFDPVTAHFPLPRIEARPNPIDLGVIPVGAPTSVLVTVFDTGEAALVLDADDPTGVLDVTTKHVEVTGGSTDAIRATLTPKAAGPLETTLILASNDPSAPKLSIKVKANGAADVPGDDAGTEAAGSCGCRTERTSTSPGLALLAFGLALAARRRQGSR